MDGLICGKLPTHCFALDDITWCILPGSDWFGSEAADWGKEDDEDWVENDEWTVPFTWKGMECRWDGYYGEVGCY
jgi:hypothetical protein